VAPLGTPRSVGNRRPTAPTGEEQAMTTQQLDRYYSGRWPTEPTPPSGPTEPEGSAELTGYQRPTQQ
jgi:hypothetical protein